jgi:hypothetical protein
VWPANRELGGDLSQLEVWGAVGEGWLFEVEHAVLLRKPRHEVLGALKDEVPAQV